MTVLRVLLAHKMHILTALAVAAIVMYVIPLDSIGDVFAAKGGDKGPPTPLPDEGNHYGWVKKGGPPPKPK